MREHVQNTGINPGLMRAKVKVGGYTTRSDHGNEIREPFDLGYDYCNMEALDGRELQAELRERENKILEITRQVQHRRERIVTARP